VTPFGPAVWGYVASLTANPTIAARVSEWQPPSPLTVPGALVWLSVIAVAALAIRRLRATRVVPWPALLTLALFGGLALTNGRGVAWWPFVAAFVVAGWLPAEPDPRPTPPLLRRLNAVTVAILAVVAFAVLPPWRPLGAAGVPVGVVTYAPQGIANALRSVPQREVTGHRARVWNPQAWGSWLEFAAPGFLYAVDSRIELFASERWDEAASIQAGLPGSHAVLEATGATVVVIDRSAGEGFEAEIRTAAAPWARIYADCDGSIWYQVGPPGYRGPQPADAPMPACP
jgi:hypothetical protein